MGVVLAGAGRARRATAFRVRLLRVRLVAPARRRQRQLEGRPAPAVHGLGAPATDVGRHGGHDDHEDPLPRPPPGGPDVLRRERGRHRRPRRHVHRQRVLAGLEQHASRRHDHVGRRRLVPPALHVRSPDPSDALTDTRSASIATSSAERSRSVIGLDLRLPASWATITDSDSAASHPALARIVSAVRIDDVPYPVPRHATATDPSSSESSRRKSIAMRTITNPTSSPRVRRTHRSRHSSRYVRWTALLTWPY